MHRRSFAAVTGIAAVMAAMLPVTSANAATVNCGDTITADVVLDSDLACAGEGLTVGGNGITLDLGGHSLSTAPGQP